MIPSSDFNSELNDYIQQNQDEDWTFDYATGVYVIHSKRRVMYNIDNQWVCGDYDSIYNSERYIFDTNTQTWFDTVTKHYSVYDETTQSYVPLTDEYWSGHPEGTQSIRFVVASSPHYKTGRVVIVDENGMTIGRDRSWDSRLRLPEMIVSKYHAMVFLDKKDKQFYIIDNGSQHGTFVNELRLSEAKQSSLPYELRHLDIVRIGSTSLEVHKHNTGMPCQTCLTNEPINIHTGTKTKEKTIETVDLEQSRREWIREAKKLYRSDNHKDTEYVDRAEIRRQTGTQQKFVDPFRKPHLQVNNDTRPTTLNTPVQGIGNKMLQKMGWQEGTSLGRDQTGILEPIQPVTQLSRSGLGSQRPINESRKDKQWRQAQERFQNIK